ncbi:MAG: hypothetical protein LEGION0403_FIIPPAGN_01541 [Legionella sp.]|uniref:hypothetical protein n=1 Tax=Legionella sp. TaxID=459 RepID=UPI003D0CC99D
MRVWHLFNAVLNDGIGDFIHFVDIYIELKNNPAFQEIKFIPVISVMGEDQKKIERIENQLRSLNITEYYCAFMMDFLTFTPSFLKGMPSAFALSLRESEQALFISTDFLYEPIFQRFLPSKAPVKMINEHEIIRSLYKSNSPPYPMGLGDECYGIKIREFPKRTIKDASEIIREHDLNFYNRLLMQTNTDSFQELYEKNLVIPAYFNHSDGFDKLLTLLAFCPSSSKGIVLYYSGRTLFNFELEILAENLGITIECISGDKVSIFNPNYERVFKLFIGNYITDQSYDALFSCAEIVGVSGDNTLESSVSHQVLPFYMSTNFRLKKSTLEMLQKISQQTDISISNEARDSFNVYFDPDYYMGEDFALKSKRLNLNAMMKDWPIIASYLKENRNFYSRLKEICFEGISRDLTNTNKLSGNKTLFFPSQHSEKLGNAREPYEDIINSDEYQNKR